MINNNINGREDFDRLNALQKGNGQKKLQLSKLILRTARSYMWFMLILRKPIMRFLWGIMFLSL